jgi:hypothetical protein
MPVGPIVDELLGCSGLLRGCGNEARARHHFAVIGEPYPFAQPERFGLAHLLAVVLFEVGLPADVELLVRLPGGTADRAVDAPRDHLPAVVLRHRPERGVAVHVGDPGQEPRAVEVPDVALRPAAHEVRHLVETGEPLFEHVGAQVHVEDRRSVSPAARVLALLEHGEPLEDPAGLRLVGRPPLSHDAVEDRGDARDVVGVKDVRVLVRDELEVPVVVVAER